MRLDFDALQSRLKEGALRNAFARIIRLEDYTLLNPPFVQGTVCKLVERAQQKLNAHFPADYVALMMCCDGGLLFTTEVFSLLSDDNEVDLVQVNTNLWTDRIVPERYLAIAMVNYGDYVALDRDGGTGTLTLWDVERKRPAGTWPDINSWLNEEIDNAATLIEQGVLLPIESDDPEA